MKQYIVKWEEYRGDEVIWELVTPSKNAKGGVGKI